MDSNQILARLKAYQNAGKKLFTTSSFQTHSLVLLHIISQLERSIPVFLINTGYLFPETLQFVKRVSLEFGLQLVEIESLVPKVLQRGQDGRLLFASDPDQCCELNKVQPMDSLLREYDVWVNGVRRDQSAVRQLMREEETAPHNTLRFHPMLDWDNRKIYDYIRSNDLPRHPLDAQGFQSIGCEPCTRRIDAHTAEREARWFGLNKVECGLHTDLILKS